jgi:nucleotide-binding universal stress UspA family protein
MQRILVAIDGSSGSEKALEVAVKQAQIHGGQVIALAVLRRPGDPALERITEAARKEARSRLEDVLQAAVHFARSRGVPLTPLLREGHPAETIVTCAEQEKVELVVLGSHNGHGRPPGLGGTADQVSNHAPCTVMIVR